MKENFLLQVIKQFVERLKLPEGYNFIFGGGTSLVCAYDELTKRFSEDGDFVLFQSLLIQRLLGKI